MSICPIWLDVRKDISCYTPEEMLYYYRSAHYYIINGKLLQENFDTLHICKKICSYVDLAIAAMSCDNNYRVTQIAKLFSLEYCKPQISITAKLEICKISRSTYYNYLREGKVLFNGIIQKMFDRK